MKKTLLAVALFGLFALSIKAQESRPHCFTDEITNSLLENDPQYRQNRAALEAFTADWINNHKNDRLSSSSSTASSQLYIIPVVFHILHDYGQENVSDAEIRSSVALMNLDYRKLNADTAYIIPAFQSLAADCEIEFRLATIDPNGNCTSGIEHIWTLETYLADDSSKRSPNYQIWPNNKYLNIWVAHSLQNASAAAYAHLPGGSNNTDGIMCWYTYVDNTSHTLTHEAGHHFNLLHVWGGSNQPGVSCGDDGVSDTPITKGWDHCPNQNQAAVCNPPTIENYQNFMEYSYCDNMFTYGQKQRMVLCLGNATSGRNNLWTNANLIATGTDQVYPVTCAPVADFKPESNSTCVNSPIHFYDQSWKGITTNWSWEFPGGNPSTSNDTNPSVSYPAPGVYTATLVASNSYGADTVIKTSIVHVSGLPQIALPWSEDFEDTTAAFPGIDGWVHNNDGGSINWALNSYASKDSGTHSIRINNYTNTVRNKEEWITPSFSFIGVTYPIKLSFDVAYAQRSASTEDEFRIYYSTDCGMNWQATSYFKSGALLATNGGSYVTNSFTPNQSQWRRETVIVNAVQNMDNVRFKFENITKRGNNIYVDNINLTGTFTGIDEEDNIASSINVYPNPTQGVSNVDFNIIKGAVVSIEIKDVIGQSVAKVVQNKKYDSGLHQVTMPSLAPGIYMISVTVNNKPHVIRLVVS